MKRAFLFGVLAMALISSVTAGAERQHQLWNRQDDGTISKAQGAPPVSFDSRFALSPAKLNLCTASGPARYQLDVTAADGFDLVARKDLDLSSLLTPALYRASAALLAGEPGHDLTRPEDVGRLNGRARRFADVRVDGNLADLRLQIFGDSRACAGSKDAAGDLRRSVGAAEADSCEGWCTCSDCGCWGSESCCDAGCAYCWGYLDGKGACGAT